MHSKTFTAKDIADADSKFGPGESPRFFVIKQLPIEGIVPILILLDALKSSN